ncbi:MAG: molybdopterin-dependent oxidoreductase [Dehalococcoidia bacterium]
MFDASAASFSQRPSEKRAKQETWEDRYRDRWKWDKVFWGSHSVDCYPGNCPFRVYVRDGKVAHEEVAARFTNPWPGVPDRNPMGCQKGCSWHQMLYGKERVLHPLKRAGERGEGKWQRVSWDQALTEIADAIIDAIEEAGPESIIHEMTPAEGGEMAMWPTDRLLVTLLGGLRTDVNAVINDFQPGHYITWGKFNPVGSGGAFRTELSLIWHWNPIYTQIPSYHYTAEGRYNGCDVITIAPDYSPSAIHADYYIPVRPGTDGALALAMCQVIIEEKLYNEGFVKDQTDLPLLVRSDNRCFLRGSDVEEGELEDQFYFFDTKSDSIVEAPRDSLALGDLEPALEGSFQATLADGTFVEVMPVFEVLRRRLQDEYTPEKASAICGVHPDVIRMLARKAAPRRTLIGMGMNLCKYYHGDLIQRSMILLLALTGNWGRAGSGIFSWSAGSFEGPGIFGSKQRPGPEETARVLKERDQMAELLKVDDPTITEEMAAIEGMCQAIRQGLGNIIAPAFFWYDHCGYRENWNRREWSDPSMKRPFDEYMEEARSKGWWHGADRPGPDIPPRVLFEVGGNFLRRQRGGQNMLLKHLWPKLKMIVSVDWRMSTTGLHSDYVLPAAQHYEKLTFGIPNPSSMQLTLSDEAAPPAGESKSEWEIFRLLARKIEERAKERGVVEYTDSVGRVRSLDNLYYRMSLGIEDLNDLVGEWIDDTVAAGCLEEGTTLETLKEKGFAPFSKLGKSVFTLTQASDIKPGEPFVAMRWHVEDKLPYPTLTRRAQFYLDHDWFLEAGEELPVHKDNPMMGGDYPFVLTSGHNRWSIHSMNMTNKMMLNTHRGRPFMFMNSEDAKDRGIENEEEVRLFNDMGEIFVPVKISPAVQPGQVIIYNGFEPYMFRTWKSPADVEPGMVKWLHLAGGYGHFRYWPIQWQPVPIDRAIRVDVAKLDGAKGGGEA